MAEENNNHYCENCDKNLEGLTDERVRAIYFAERVANWICFREPRLRDRIIELYRSGYYHHQIARQLSIYPDYAYKMSVAKTVIYNVIEHALEEEERSRVGKEHIRKSQEETFSRFSPETRLEMGEKGYSKYLANLSHEERAEHSKRNYQKGLGRLTFEQRSENAKKYYHKGLGKMTHEQRVELSRRNYQKYLARLSPEERREIGIENYSKTGLAKLSCEQRAENAKRNYQKGLAKLTFEQRSEHGKKVYARAFGRISTEERREIGRRSYVKGLANLTFEQRSAAGKKAYQTLLKSMPEEEIYNRKVAAARGRGRTLWTPEEDKFLTSLVSDEKYRRNSPKKTLNVDRIVEDFTARYPARNKMAISGRIAVLKKRRESSF